MKIFIAGGKQEADYIISQFNSKTNKIFVINSDLKTCEYLSKKNHINVFYGKMNKEYDLSLAQLDEADLFIALSEDDIKNYISCQMAKLIFNVRKCLCAVKNPKNVDVFKQLGVDSVISSTYLLGETIKSELSIEKMIKALAFENNKVLVSELEVKKGFQVIGKSLKEIKFPKNTSVCCIYRSKGLIIPNGDTTIEEGDKVFAVSNFNDQKLVADVINAK